MSKANKKTTKPIQKSVTPFENRVFQGNIIARFMSSIEQEQFADMYTDNSNQRRTQITAPTKDDFVIATMFEDGLGYSQIAREVGTTISAVTGALDRVGRHMIRINKLTKSKKKK
jgi:hypothetical protein